MDSMLVSYYENSILHIKIRGIYGDVVSNAKPVYMLSIFNEIDNNLLKDEIFYIPENANEYKKCYNFYCYDVKATPFNKPFLHEERGILSSQVL